MGAQKVIFQNGLKLGRFVFIFWTCRICDFTISLIFSLIATLSLTAIFAWIFQVNIHVYSIAGLAISMGILIDGAIVMVDHFHRYRNTTIFRVLLASVLVIAAGISLVFFLPEEQKKNLTDFSYIILLALLSGLLVSMWFTPAFFSLFIRHNTPTDQTKKQGSLKLFSIYFSVISWIARFRKSFIILLLFCFGLPIFMLPASSDKKEWYNKTIGSEYYQQVWKPTIDAWTGGAIRLFVTSVLERSGYRKEGKTKLYVYAKLQPGNSTQQLNNILLSIESMIAPIRGIDTYITNVYSGENGMIEISFLEGYEKSSLPLDLKAKLISKSTDWGNVNWNIYGIGQGFGTGETNQIPTFRVILKGYNYSILETMAIQLESKLKENRRTSKINNNEKFTEEENSGKEWVLNLDRNTVAFSGISDQIITEQIRHLCLPSYPQTKIKISQTYYPISIKEKDAIGFSKHNLLNQKMFIDTNKLIQLSTMASLNMVSIPESIRKEDRQYIRVVSFEYLGQKEFGELYLKDQLKEFNEELPAGFSADRKASNWKWGGVENNYTLLIVLAGFIFVICAALFENLRQPIFIIITIPLSFIGSFLIFSLTDYYFDQGGYASFVMITSLTTNMGLLLMNDYNRLRKQMGAPNNALSQAIANRGKTLILTTMAACCSLIPFLVEGQEEIFWFSFSIGTLGGVVFAILAVFIALPVFLYEREN